MTRERYLSDDELVRFMRAVRERRHVHQARDYALFALLANTGIRPSEALALRRRDLHLQGPRPWIRVVRNHPDHAPEPYSHLVINRDVAKVVRLYAKTLVNPNDRPFGVTKRQIARLYHYYAGIAGITPARKVYALRHSAGVRLMHYARDIRLVQALMGHVRLKATSIYDINHRDRLLAARQQLEAV